ncbi:wall-associated receptor kinase 2-like [Olea europaea subsp. europaea]|uniref:Wall-associated receptor kinase 2-like n=2 Tax=Olea europaea subsp. europaea TaxID=158383 RepID=A0A8S0QVE7_OLEEU|nr:wall-associated receptor kinase 2-like [Olea europaea subsp. europaea]
MPRVYDNWERLVEATLLREELREIARSSSVSSISSDFGSSFSSPLHDHVPVKSPEAVKKSHLVLLKGSSLLDWMLPKRRLTKRREEFFQKNGTIRLFTAKDLRKATYNYDKRNIINSDWITGTVYKGILPDNTVVAIKKSYSDQRKIEQFMNELKIVSQINHRNVVKILGCCLESEVPLVVFEFVKNGTLLCHMHDPIRASNFSWEMRIKIAAEIAGAVAYLHSAASTPIVRGNLKSANILLDQNYSAKVGNFTTSRFLPPGHSQLTTSVEGTYGYLDPEYIRSNRLTEKIDVYSFGVILAELLTCQKALSFDLREGEINLSAYSVSAIREDRLEQVFDKNLVREDRIDELKRVAKLSEWCLRVKSEEGPTMKEVALKLEALRSV